MLGSGPYTAVSGPLLATFSTLTQSSSYLLVVHSPANSTKHNHGAEQASNETLKQTQQRNWSNAFQGGQTALKEHFAVLHYETTSTTQQPRGEHRGTIKDCKNAGATTWQGQGNHTFTTVCWKGQLYFFVFLPRLSSLKSQLFLPSVCSQVQLFQSSFQAFMGLHASLSRTTFISIQRRSFVCQVPVSCAKFLFRMTELPKPRKQFRTPVTECAWKRWQVQAMKVMIYYQNQALSRILINRLSQAVCFKVHQNRSRLAAQELIKIYQKSCVSSDESSLG